MHANITIRGTGDFEISGDTLEFRADVRFSDRDPVSYGYTGPATIVMPRDLAVSVIRSMQAAEVLAAFKEPQAASTD